MLDSGYYEDRKKYIGMRFSPIIQFGHISGLMPTDFAIDPYAVQTDIVGTGGSSGSPLLSLESGKVIGLAQQVLTAGVRVEIPGRNYNGTQRNSVGIGTAKVGLVYGVSTGLFPSLPKDIKTAVDTDTPIMIPFHSSNLKQIQVRKTPK